MADSLGLDRSIAALLRHTWDPFFSGFGRLTEVQRRAIPPVLAGDNLLVCSPTASGKTEAVCAPLLERLRTKLPGSMVLYVSPTRALVNDLFHRLEGPLDQMKLRLIRRTGDHHDSLGSDPHMLLTTPESFDSLLCRGRLDTDGHVLTRVAAVVLDEIHLLHGTPRGAQLVWLLNRLRRLRRYAKERGWSPESALQVVGLSATVVSPQEVAATYLVGATVQQVAGQRPILKDESAGDGPIEDVLLKRIRQNNAPEKILVFCNTRRRVDELCITLRAKIGKLPYKVCAHHGSLDKTERERVEEAAKAEPRIVIVATSTLEIGIDIGDIDLVVLDAAPPDVSSFLQRIGRGNRRRQDTTVMVCARSNVDAVLQVAMLDSARAGDLGPTRGGPQFAVGRQQLASYIFQSPRPSRGYQSLIEFMTECEPRLDGRALLDHLVAENELLRDGDQVRLGEAWLEASQSGEIHSNIESSPGTQVVDAVTGAVIASGIRAQSGPQLGTGGQVLHVTQRDDFRIHVHRDAKAAVVVGEWRYVTNRRFVGASQPYCLRKHLQLEPDEWPVIQLNGIVYAFHLGGGEMAAVLQLMAKLEASPVTINPWYLSIAAQDCTKPQWIENCDLLGVRAKAESQLEKVESWLARPFANKRLPRNVRLAEALEWLHLEPMVQSVRRSRWLPASRSAAAILQEFL